MHKHYHGVLVVPSRESLGADKLVCVKARALRLSSILSTHSNFRAASHFCSDRVRPSTKRYRRTYFDALVDSRSPGGALLVREWDFVSLGIKLH